MDTGDARIKVTVEPVLYSGPRASHSPSKRPTRSASRTTTVPLRTGESSTAKWLRQPTPAAHVDSSTLDVTRRSSRKRKGTPGSTKDIVERRSSRRQSHMMSTRSTHTVDHDRAMDRAMFSEQSVPSSEVRRRRSLYPMRNQRSQRLSAARDDLDDALQAAIGGTSAASADSERDDYLSSDGVGAGAAGELTAANEDFTMVTGASLASISFKANATMLDDAAHDEHDAEDIEEDHAQGEHLTSSPPQKVMYPDITEQVDEAKTLMPERNYDDMNWKSTGPKAMRLQLHDVHENEEISISIEHGSDPHDPIMVDGVEPGPKNLSPTAETHSRHSSHVSQNSARKPLIQEDATIGASYSENGDEMEDDDESQDEHANDDQEAMEVVQADDDIWAEEASRDIDDSAISATSTRPQGSLRSRAPNNQAAKATIKAPPILPEEQPDPPRRAKLPRTWRKTGEEESSYADSTTISRPANLDVPVRSQTALDQSGAPPAQRTSGDEGESGRSSGVLTPPSTDDDDNRRKLHDANLIDQNARSGQMLEKEVPEDDAMDDDEVSDRDNEVDEEEEPDISGFTNPGAADTQLEAHHRFGRQHVPAEDEEEEDHEDDIASPNSESGSSPDEDGEDTGFFWQKNLPQVYRSGKEKPKPQRKKPIDLSAILRMDSSKVEEVEPATAQTSKPNLDPVPTRPKSGRPIFSVRRKPAVVATRARPVESSPENNNEHILPSPVRRSLLRSSKALYNNEPKQPPVIRKPARSAPEPMVEESQVTVTDDSLASKASDQQQLLCEMKAATPVARKPAHERLAVLRETSQSTQVGAMSNDVSYEETDTTFKNSWPEHSYEENLNIASPQKINVKFNDSTLSFRNEQQQHQSRPNLLAPRGPIKPLFEKSTNAQFSQSSAPKNGKQNLSTGPPTITLVPSRRPAQITTHQESENVFTRLSTTFWSAVARPQGPPPTPGPSARTTEQTISLSLRAQLRSRYGVLPNSHPWTMAHMRTLHRLLNSLESGRRDSIVPTHAPMPAHLRDIIGEGRLSATGRSFRFEEAHACVVQAFLQLLVTPALFQSMQRGEVEWLGDAQAEHLRGEMGGRTGSDLCFKTLKPKRGLIDWEWVIECLGCCIVSNVEMGMRRVAVPVIVERERTVRDAEMSVMGDGEGDGRVREWFERSSGRGAV
jgi:hypothetical protein